MVTTKVMNLVLHKPILYKAISKHKIRDLYAEKLIQENIISTGYVKELEEAYKTKLDEI